MGADGKARSTENRRARRVEGSVPKVAAPSKNVIVPLGVASPGVFEVTMAVNVSDWPKTAEGAELATATVVPEVA